MNTCITLDLSRKRGRLKSFFDLREWSNTPEVEGKAGRSNAEKEITIGVSTSRAGLNEREASETLRASA